LGDKRENGMINLRGGEFKKETKGVGGERRVAERKMWYSQSLAEPRV